MGRAGAGRRLGRIVGFVAGVVLALALAAPAWAASATATLAPIGTGSYLLTVTNTGSETINGFVVAAGEEPVPTNIVPNPACKYGNSPVSASINCTVTVAPGGSTQMCYTGHPLAEFVPGSSILLLGPAAPYAPISAAPPVASCPLPGFSAGTKTTGTGSTPGSSNKGTHAWTRTQCKGAYKAWSKKHGHANRSQKKAEANKLHKLYSCPLSILK
jgi:hypothetical protein